MKRKFCLITIILLIIFSTDSPAKSNRQKDIYDAYISGNMVKWASIVREMENEEGVRTSGQKMELLEYYYGLAAYYLSVKNDKLARITIVKADEMMGHLLKVFPNNATLNSYRGSFTAYKISLDKYKIVVLGTESLKYLNRAYQLDPTDVHVLTDKGHALFNAPKMFGGNKAEAIQMYLKSIALMEKTNKDTKNWFYLNTLVYIAKAYTIIGQPEKAIPIYEKVMQKEPDFIWVKNKLYPELLRSIAN